MNRYTLQEIKGSFNRKADKNSFIVRNILRPASYYLTYLLMRIGVSANLATFLSLVIGVISALFFILGERLFYMGTLFYILFWLFDFADGNIARISNTASYYGKFLDGMVDALVETLLPLSIAVGLFVRDGYIIYLTLSLLASLSLLFAFFALNRIAFFKRWLELDEGRNSNIKELNPLKQTRLPVQRLFNFFTDLKISLLITAIFTGMTMVLFMILTASIFIWSAILITIALQDGHRNLRILRISRLSRRFAEKNQKSRGS